MVREFEESIMVQEAKKGKRNELDINRLKSSIYPKIVGPGSGLGICATQVFHPIVCILACQAI